MGESIYWVTYVTGGKTHKTAYLTKEEALSQFRTLVADEKATNVIIHEKKAK